MAPKPSQGFSPARRGALQILESVFAQNAFASERIDAYLRRHRFKTQDRGLLTQLVYGVLRRHGTLQALLERWIRPQTPPWVKRALEMGLYQLLFLQKIPDHAVLYETVESIKARGGAAMGALANAVLRKAQGERDRILAEIAGDEWILRDYPSWLWARWNRRYGGEKARALGKKFNETPVLWARLAPGAEAGSMNLPPHPQGIPFVKIPEGTFQEVQPWIRKGWLTIQDPGSYELVRQLDPLSGELGLDACAGHGGKAAVIAERLRAQGGEEGLSVYDVAPLKLKELKNNFKRLGLKTPRPMNPRTLSRGGPWDWILLDAPCSGLGTLGRKPELRWKTREADLQRHHEAQSALLQGWAPRVKAGGRILYGVCSLEPEEGTLVVERFLKAHPAWRLDGQGWLWPGQIGEDGFFWARIISNRV